MTNRAPTQEVSRSGPTGPLGRYEIVRPLATGGMAELFLARARGIEGFEKQVVIKKIRAEYGTHEMFIDMLLDEARLAATLDHHNIAHVHDVGIDEDGYYLAMEYLRGHDAREILRRAQATGRRIPMGCALAIVSGLAAGLAYAHQRRDASGQPMRIVHRDVSPGNAFVTLDGGVKLLDFGIARATSRTSNTRPGMQKGKVSYMSPEQCAGREIDHRSDIFSLGIVLYELTTVRAMNPRGKLGDYDFMKRIVRCEFKKPSEVRPDYPAKLEAIVLKALAANPDDRYQSALDLAADLEEFARRERLPMTASSLSTFVNHLMASVSERADTIQEPTIHSVIDARAARYYGLGWAERVPPPAPSVRDLAAGADSSLSISIQVDSAASAGPSVSRESSIGTRPSRVGTATGLWLRQPRGASLPNDDGDGSDQVGHDREVAASPWARWRQVPAGVRGAAVSLAAAACLAGVFAIPGGSSDAPPVARAAATPAPAAACVEAVAPGVSGEGVVMTPQVAEALAPSLELPETVALAHCRAVAAAARRETRRRGASQRVAAAPARSAPAPRSRRTSVDASPPRVRAVGHPVTAAPSIAVADAPVASEERRVERPGAAPAERVAARDAEAAPGRTVARRTAIAAAIAAPLVLGDDDAPVVALVGDGQALPEGTKLIGRATRRRPGQVGVLFTRAILPAGDELVIAAESRHDVSDDELREVAAQTLAVSTRLRRRLNDGRPDAGATAGATEVAMLATPDARDMGEPAAPPPAPTPVVELAEDTALRVVFRKSLDLPD